MSLTIEQRVDKGIELLQTYLPDEQWAFKVDPDLLNMHSTQFCMFGQLAPYIGHHRYQGHALSGYYLAAAWIEADQDVTSVHDDGDWIADYGFQSALAEWQGDESEFDQVYPDLTAPNLTDMAEYELLQAEWIKRIKKIREASHG